MVEALLIYGAIQTIGVLIGVMIAALEIRHMRQAKDMELETRQAQLFMQIYNTFNSKAFVSQLNDLRYRWKFTD